MQKSQLLINELQKKLIMESSRQNRTTKGFQNVSNTLDSVDLQPICCTKCTEEMEIKIRQIENLKKYFNGIILICNNVFLIIRCLK